MRIGRAVVAASVVAAGLLWVSPVVSAQSGQVLSPVQAATLTGPQLSLTAPADGRLASYMAEVTVEGVAFVGQVTDTDGSVTWAAPGSELAVVHLHLNQFLGMAGAPAGSPVVTLVSGSGSAPLAMDPSGYPNPDDAFFAVAVTKGAPAVLSLSTGGVLAETFDLRAGSRPAGEPPILYRAQNAPYVDVGAGGVSALSASSSVGAMTGTFGVREATLAAWQPMSTTVSTDPQQVFVGVDLVDPKFTVAGYIPGSVDGAVSLSGSGAPISASQVTFTLSDGRTIPARVVPAWKCQVDLAPL